MPRLWNISIGFFITVLLVCLTAQVGLLVLVFRSSAPIHILPALPTKSLQTQRSYFMNRDFYDDAYAHAPVWNTQQNVAAAVIPHHLLVKNNIAAFFNTLNPSRYDTIILVSPNHFNRGNADVLMSNLDWDTPYGILSRDTTAINSLMQSGIGVDEYAFANEHGISGLTSFIKKSLPTVKIVPVILKYNTTQAELDSLLSTLQKNTNPEKTLFIASVDFSHYMPAAVADLHDQTAIGALQSLDEKRIDGLEVDSKPALKLLLQWTKTRNAIATTLLSHTDSDTLVGKPDEAGTSHIIMTFSNGKQTTTTNATFLFFGDIMLDRNVATLVQNKGFSYILDQLAGQEGRFFQGVDIMSANLEGAVTLHGEHYPPVAGNDFAFDPINVAALKKYGFTFFNSANNHLADQGAPGIKQTDELLTQLGFNHSGCADAVVGDCSSTIITVAGKKIGMVGFSRVYHDIDLEKAAAIVGNLKKQTDAVIVNVHGGTEYQHEFNRSQQAFAHALVDAGADLVIGHHPHVVEGMEIYRNVPIFYSLGNFIFDQYFSPDTQEGLSVGATLQFDEHNRVTGVQAYVYPYQMQKGKIILRQGDDKQRFLQRFLGWSTVSPEVQEQVMRQFFTVGR